MADRAKSPQTLDVLLKEYEQRRNEIIAFYDRYDKQTQVLTLYLSILALLTLGILGINRQEHTISLPGAGSLKIAKDLFPFVTLLGTLAITTGIVTAFFLISNLMEIVHVSQLLSARSGALEAAINGCLDQEVMTWDSKLVPEFYGSRWRSGPFVEPSFLVGLWSLLIFAIVVAVFSGLSWLLMQRMFWWWAVPVWAFAAYHICEWVWLISKRHSTMSTVAAYHLVFSRPEERPRNQ